MRNFLTSRNGPGIYLGRIKGIAIYLDYSWFLMAGLVTFSLAELFSSPDVSEFPPNHQGYAVYLLMGAAGTLLFFLSILLHELGHSVVSQRCGIQVPRITLRFIGGVAEIAREPDDAVSELKIALGGPAVSLVLVGLYWGLQDFLSRIQWNEAAVVFFWLAIANVSLVVFNMIPGYPLDGGRVLRALIWARTGNLIRSTFITSRIGIGFGWLLIAWGIYSVVFVHQITAVTLFLIAVFLKNAAERGYHSALQRELLADICVRDLMVSNPVTIPASMPLDEVMNKVLPAHHHSVFPVCGPDRQFVGMLETAAVLKLAGNKRRELDAQKAVDPTSLQHSMSIHASASQAMRALYESSVTRLAVLDDEDCVAGIVTRHDIQHVIQVRQSSGS